MTATDELRRLLDERGVEWGNIRNDGSESNFFTEWQFDGIDGRATATEWSAGNNLSMAIYRWGLTPAQAVEATFGRGTCRLEREPNSNRLWWCSSCQSYHEHVSEFPWEYCPRCGAKVVEQ